MLSRLVVHFFNFLNQIKTFHWQTTSFALHKSSDELYASFSALVDRFVEAYQGRSMARVEFTGLEKLTTPLNCTPEQYVEQLIKMREYLTIRLPSYVDVSRDTDLVTIRDDMIEQINKALYGSTLS